MGAQIGKHIQSDCNGNHSVLTTTAARNHDQHHAKQNMNEGNVEAGANMLYGDVVNKREPVDDDANDLTDVTNTDSVELKEQILAEVYKQSKNEEMVENVKGEDLLKLVDIKENSIKKEADQDKIEIEKHTDKMQMHDVQNDEMPLDEAQIDEVPKNEVLTDDVQKHEEHSQEKEVLLNKEILVTALEEDLHTLKQFKFEFPNKEDEELQSSSGTDNFWDALTTAPSTQASRDLIIN